MPIAVHKNDEMRILFCLCYFVLMGSFCFAQTSLPSIFGDGMVLQQQSNVAVWGMDKPNSKIVVSGSWGETEKTKSDADGKWKLRINTPTAGGPYELEISGSEVLTFNDVLIGEVWLCSGQSNMLMPLRGFVYRPETGYENEKVIDGMVVIERSNNDQIRLFQGKHTLSLTPLDDTEEGQWRAVSPESTPHFSAVGFFFGTRLQRKLKVPVGLIQVAFGSSTIESWMSPASLAEFPEIEIVEEIPETFARRTATVFYNGMLKPLLGYGIKGCIWYQGEANRRMGSHYENMMAALVSSWREEWDIGEFPFYFAQITPYNYKNNVINSAFLREAQLKASESIPNADMIVTMDLGSCTSMHPPEKRKVGHRFANLALSQTYQRTEFACYGPAFKESTVNGNGRMVLSFDHAESGLKTDNNGIQVDGFELAGPDRVFHAARARVNRNGTVTVWCDQVPEPKEVRYAFGNCVPGNLFNGDGLPASPFRSDDWPEDFQR